MLKLMEKLSWFLKSNYITPLVSISGKLRFDCCRSQSQKPSTKLHTEQHCILYDSEILCVTGVFQWRSQIMSFTAFFLLGLLPLGQICWSRVKPGLSRAGLYIQCTGISYATVSDLSAGRKTSVTKAFLCFFLLLLSNNLVKSNTDLETASEDISRRAITSSSNINNGNTLFVILDFPIRDLYYWLF